MPTVTMLLAAGIGLAIGTPLAAFAERTVSRARLLAPGWWRGGHTPPGEVALVALLASALFAACGYRFAGSATLPAWCWMTATGIVLATVDLRHRRLPHRVTAAMAGGGALLLSVAAAVEAAWPQLVSALLAGTVVLVTAVIVQVAAPTHTGGGDTALYGALALYLGWFGWAGLVRGLLLAAGLTALVGIAVWITRRSATTTFPAGPSLIAGAIVAVLLG